MIIGAVDPGHVHGLAIYSTEDGLIGAWEVATPELATFLVACGVVVCESYLVTDTKNTQQTEALEAIGVIEKLCKDEGIRLVMQQPSTAKKFSKDDKLKALGWFWRTKDGHANDAARHLLRFAVKEKYLRADEMNTLRTVLKGTTK